MEAEHNNRKYIIEQDRPDVGVYLYVYEQGKCMYDYLQDTVEQCIVFAEEEFGVPLSAWKHNI